MRRATIPELLALPGGARDLWDLREVHRAACARRRRPCTACAEVPLPCCPPYPDDEADDEADLDRPLELTQEE